MTENAEQSTPAPPPVSPIRRIVLQHTRGPFRGLMQILGRTNEHPNNTPPTESGEFTATPYPRKTSASLTRTEKHYLVYKEHEA